MALWLTGVTSIEAMYASISKLGHLGEEDLVAAATQALGEHLPRVAAVELLRYLRLPATLATADRLVDLASHDRYALSVRAALGRLDQPTAAALVPPLVMTRLPNEDYIGIIRYGELLRDLSLFNALKELLRFTRQHDDPEVQTIGPDYFPEWSSE